MSYYAREPYDDPTFDLDRHMSAARRHERALCPFCGARHVDLCQPAMDVPLTGDNLLRIAKMLNAR